ncbi:MAG: hypothetical protein WC881_02235 [Elusimicrobiota bacterium]
MAAALFLLPFLGNAILVRGPGVFLDLRYMLFPCLWFYLVGEQLLERQRMNDGQVFLLGGAFAFWYEGLFTKGMQDGIAWSGLDWLAVISGPFEWGMIAVMLFHCLAAVSPRCEAGSGLGGLLRSAAIVIIAAGAGAVYVVKTWYGHYQVEYLLGPMWVIADIATAAMGFGLWRLWRRSLASESAYRNPAGVWILAGLGLGLLGYGLLAGVGAGLNAPSALVYMAQAIWSVGLGIGLWNSWRGRQACSDEPVPRSRLVLAAVGLRVTGALLLLFLYGPSGDESMAFWSTLICDFPAKLLFYYAFLTSRLEV